LAIGPYRHLNLVAPPGNLAWPADQERHAEIFLAWSMKFKRFTKPKFLKQVGQEWLGKLFGRFSAALATTNVALPAAELEDEACFKEFSGLARAPDGLPDNLIETLWTIEENRGRWRRLPGWWRRWLRRWPFEPLLIHAAGDLCRRVDNTAP
jgi:hypothetical protein